MFVIWHSFTNLRINKIRITKFSCPKEDEDEEQMCLCLRFHPMGRWEANSLQFVIRQGPLFRPSKIFKTNLKKYWLHFFNDDDILHSFSLCPYLALNVKKSWFRKKSTFLVSKKTWKCSWILNSKSKNKICALTQFTYVCKTGSVHRRNIFFLEVP